MDTLSSDQVQLLSWIKNCQRSISIAEMQDLQVPAFSEQRVNTLRKTGYLSFEYVVYRGELVGGYSVSDKGKAYLEHLEQLRQDHAQQRADIRTNHKITVFASIISAVAGSLLTLMVEHFGEIVQLVQSVFR